jgi:hypothetical protein
VKRAVIAMHAHEIRGQWHKRARQVLVVPAIIEWNEFAHVGLLESTNGSIQTRAREAAMTQIGR